MSDVPVAVEESAKPIAPLAEGSLWRAIWVMSWPLMLMTMSSSLISMTDVYMAGKLGSANQAAVGAAEQVIFLYFVVILSAGVGTTALVSRALGADNEKEARKSIAQSLLTSMVLGFGLCLLSWFGSASILDLLHPPKEILELGAPYLKIYGFYLIPLSIVCIVNAAFRSSGDARIPLLIGATQTIVNILGDYLCIYQNWPIPGLGIRGIAASGVVAGAVGSLLALYKLSRSRLAINLIEFLAIDTDLIWRFVNISAPSVVQSTLRVLGTYVLFFTLRNCPHATESLASWAIGMRIEGFLFMPMFALGLAVASIVGQNLGAKQFERAVQAGWNVTKIGVSLMLLAGTALFLCAEPIARIMSNDIDTIAFTTAYLRINALSEPFLAINFVLGGALQGAGDTRSPMWISILCSWLIRLPFAWLLAISCKLGTPGVWIAMTCSMTCSGIFMALRFQSRKWLATKV